MTAKADKPAPVAKRRTYARATTWTSEEFTKHEDVCQVCRTPIIEYRPRYSTLGRRIECHQCLARYFENRRRVPRGQQQTN